MHHHCNSSDRFLILFGEDPMRNMFRARHLSLILLAVFLCPFFCVAQSSESVQVPSDGFLSVVKSIFSGSDNKRWAKEFEKDKIRPEVLKLADQIAEVGTVESAYVGYGGSPSAQYKKYEAMASASADQELVELTDHPSPAVRVYAFKALLKRDYSPLFPIIERHLTDDVTFQTQSGCNVMQQSVIEKFVENVVWYHKSGHSDLINSAEWRTIADSMIKNHRRLPITREVEKIAPASEEQYEIIKTAAMIEVRRLTNYRKDIAESKKVDLSVVRELNSKQLSSVELLAKYKRETDLTLLRDGLEQAIDFLKTQANVDRQKNPDVSAERFLMNAIGIIANYPHQDFGRYLDELITTPNYERSSEYNLQKLFQALISFGPLYLVDAKRLVLSRCDNYYMQRKDSFKAALQQAPSVEYQDLYDSLPEDATNCLGARWDR